MRRDAAGRAPIGRGVQHSETDRKDRTMVEKLFTPLQAGALHLRNRVVMAPLTRNRAPRGDVPAPLDGRLLRASAPPPA